MTSSAAARMRRSPDRATASTWPAGLTLLDAAYHLAQQLLAAAERDNGCAVGDEAMVPCLSSPAA